MDIIPSSLIEAASKSNDSFMSLLKYVLISLIGAIGYGVVNIKQDNALQIAGLITLFVLFVLILLFTIHQWYVNHKKLMATAYTEILEKTFGDSLSNKNYLSNDKHIKNTTAQPSLVEPSKDIK